MTNNIDCLILRWILIRVSSLNINLQGVDKPKKKERINNKIKMIVKKRPQNSNEISVKSQTQRIIIKSQAFRKR